MKNENVHFSFSQVLQRLIKKIGKLRISATGGKEMRGENKNIEIKNTSRGLI